MLIIAKYSRQKATATKISLRLSKVNKNRDFGEQSKVGDVTVKFSFSFILFPHGFALRAEPNCEAK